MILRPNVLKICGAKRGDKMVSSEDLAVLKQMKNKIDQINQLTIELKALGKGIKTVEKNSRNILSATYNLKFTISDIVDIEEN
jgi:hypothetical protein